MAYSYNRRVQAELKIHQKVTLPKGHRVGMKRLKEDTEATVVSKHSGDEGAFFYRVNWTDSKGRDKSTYITESEIK